MGRNTVNDGCRVHSSEGYDRLLKGTKLSTEHFNQDGTSCETYRVSQISCENTEQSRDVMYIPGFWQVFWFSSVLSNTPVIGKTHENIGSVLRFEGCTREILP